jgi:hypothetical protein
LNADNSYHVLITSDLDESTSFEQIAIKHGLASGDGSIDYTGKSYFQNRGGGMYNYNSSPKIKDSYFSNNSAFYGGAALYNNTSDPSISNCEFVGNISADFLANNTIGSGGGAINNNSSDPTIVDCIFAENEALYRGGAMVNMSSNPIVTDCSFTNNKAFGGVAIYNNGGSLSFSNCTFDNHTQIIGALGVGGESGTLVSVNANVTLSECTFSNNFGTKGAAISHSSGDSITINKCLFENNVAYLSAGGIFGSEDSGTAGAIYIESVQCTINNCIFDSNKSNDGGAIYLVDAQANITDCSFNKNDANEGGAIGCEGGATTITNSSFAKNDADSGGAIYSFDNNTFQVDYSTFVQNTADLEGGMLYSENSFANINNSIIWDNSSAFYELNSTTTFTNCLVEFGTASCVMCPGGNGDVNPIFINADDSDGLDNILGTSDDGINLQAASPAIDMGALNNAPPEDVAGSTRIGNPDIGAYEAASQGNIIHVNGFAQGNGSGTTWSDAMTNLQDALDLRMLTSRIDSICIAQGTYYPSSSPDESTADLRDKSFHLADSNVVVLGGYDPILGSQTGDTTFLSGNLVLAGIAPDRAYHVMVTVGLDNTSVFDKLTFRDGKANGPSFITYKGRNFQKGKGGTLLNVSSSPTFSNCNFTRSYADFGGGINMTLSSPIFTDCMFTRNMAIGGGGFFNEGSNSSFTNCDFSENQAQQNGAAILSRSGSVILTDSNFSNNIGGQGNAVFSDGGTITVRGTVTVEE